MFTHGEWLNEWQGYLATDRAHVDDPLVTQAQQWQECLGHYQRPQYIHFDLLPECWRVQILQRTAQ